MKSRTLIILAVALIVVACEVVVAAEKKKKEKLTWPEDQKNLLHITYDNFQSEIVEKPRYIMVLVYKPTGCAKCAAFKDDYLKVADTLNNYMQVALLDASTKGGKDIAKMFQIKAYPTLFIFQYDVVPNQGGQYVKLPFIFEGASWDAESVVRWAIESMPAKDIRRIESMGDHDDYLREYKEEKLPKIVLLTKEDVVSPMYRSLAAEFHYRAHFGYVTPEADDVRKLYEETEVPAVYAVADATGIRHIGSLTFDALRKFIEKHALPIKKRSTIQSKFLREEEKLRKRDKEEEKFAHLPKPIDITTVAEWKSKCIERRTGLCLAAFLDPNDSSYEKHKEELEAIPRKIAAKVTVTIQVAHINGPLNNKIAEFFGLRAGFPAIAYIQPAKKAYYTMLSSFRETNIFDLYVQKAKLGKGGKVYDPTKVPSFVAGGEHGDEL